MSPLFSRSWSMSGLREGKDQRCSCGWTPCFNTIIVQKSTWASGPLSILKKKKTVALGYSDIWAQEKQTWVQQRTSHCGSQCSLVIRERGLLCQSASIWGLFLRPGTLPPKTSSPPACSMQALRLPQLLLLHLYVMISKGKCHKITHHSLRNFIIVSLLRQEFALPLRLSWTGHLPVLALGILDHRCTSSQSVVERCFVLFPAVIYASMLTGYYLGIIFHMPFPKNS